MTTNLRASGVFIIMTEDEPDEVSAGGIVLVSGRPNEVGYAHVVSAGPGDYTDSGSFIATTLVAGDRVVFHRRAVGEFHFEGRDYLVARQVDLLAKVEDDFAKMNAAMADFAANTTPGGTWVMEGNE